MLTIHTARRQGPSGSKSVPQDTVCRWECEASWLAPDMLAREGSLEKPLGGQSLYLWSCGSELADNQLRSPPAVKHKSLGLPPHRGLPWVGMWFLGKGVTQARTDPCSSVAPPSVKQLSNSYVVDSSCLPSHGEPSPSTVRKLPLAALHQHAWGNHVHEWGSRKLRPTAFRP